MTPTLRNFNVSTVTPLAVPAVRFTVKTETLAAPAMREPAAGLLAESETLRPEVGAGTVVVPVPVPVVVPVVVPVPDEANLALVIGPK